MKAELERTRLTLRKLGLHIAETDRSAVEPETLSLLLSECPLHALHDQASNLLPIIRRVETAPERLDSGRTRYRSGKRLAVTPAMRALLKTKLQNQQLPLSAIGRSHFPEFPQGRLNTLISRLIYGQQKTLKEDEWLRIKTVLDSVSENEFPTKPTPKPAIPHIPKKQDTATTLSERRYQDLRPDLDSETIPSPKSRPALANYKLSDRMINMGYIIIDDELYDRLHAHRRRSGVSIRRLLKSSADAPNDLPVTTVQAWFNGSTLSAERRLVNWVLDAYGNLPDRGTR
ncbi:hypothetical protein [Henriciella mobilis]|uniref:hypothetical protein n=1 Tax=Henriciella mobilis TaxID=2305467 RepID=UPI0011C372B7|nr:hypothetical protein [Henriciella mobilis]